MVAYADNRPPGAPRVAEPRLPGADLRAIRFDRPGGHRRRAGAGRGQRRGWPTTRAVQSAKASGKQYIYLGSAQRPNDTYKFQFDGIEWFDGESWQTDFEKLKNILQKV